MLPGGSLSIISMPAPIIGARSLQGTMLIDYEDGPIGLNDPSYGLNYQVWTLKVTEFGIYIESENTHAEMLISAFNITEASLTFDQNGRPTIVYVQYARAFIWWYDSSIASRTTTDLGTGIRSPKIILDDKRQWQSSNSDIIVGYIKNDNLCYCQQRDRFSIEYVLAQNVFGRIQKLGMGNNFRLQFIVGNY